MNYLLEFQNVSKEYALGGYHRSLRKLIPNLIKALAGRGKKEVGTQKFWALKDVSFGLVPGQALALIGPNGAGKTTVLKLATSVTQPTSGRVSLNGRASALIELGAGFHPDLTGRENIYLNGTILGMDRQEVSQRFDEIVAFSELEKFLDTPVKRYSSGMYARLGFSVAAHVRPQVLIVDEVLAVGDVAFQTKCLARMAEMKRDGTTIIIVSHAMPRLQRLCNRGILLYRGEIIQDGPIDDVIHTYQSDSTYSSNLRNQPALVQDNPEGETPHNSPVRITGISFRNKEGLPILHAVTNEPLVVRISYLAKKRIDNPIVEVWFHAADGTTLSSNTTEWDQLTTPAFSGAGYIDLVIDPLPFARGRYLFGVALTAADGVTRYDWHWQRYPLEVKSDQFTHGLLSLPHSWRWSQQEISNNSNGNHPPPIFEDRN